MSRLICEICGTGMAEMATLYRVNEKGVPGIWRCKLHLTHDQEASIDPVEKDIIEIIEEDTRRNTQ